MVTIVPAFGRLGEENAFAVLARAGQLAAVGRDIVNLGIGQPDMPTPPHIVEAGVKALRDGHHGYTPAVGILPLREAVARDVHRRHGVEVSPDSVMIVPGGKVTMFMAILMFGEPGAEILYPDPGFPIYRSMIEFTGATPVPVPIREANGFAFSAEETLGLITARTRLLILNSPANPTGGVTPKAEIDALVAGLATHPDVAVLSDEIYGTMTYDGAAHHSLLRYPEIRERLIYLDGASKTYAMTGWRLGWSVWPKPLYDAARKLAVNAHSCVNAATQWAGIAALDGPQDCVAEMVAEFDRRRGLVVEGLNALPDVSCITPKGAFYAFPNVERTGWKAKALASALLEEAGVATIGGPDFGVHGEVYIRLSYANSPENILRALERMGTFLAARPNG
ncbi:pyridoxal phosphate-dependent aminotransferase [Methylobacterium oxalidis]|uniref:Aminotransferase n=1 Tax=Methylobacterium oxalidis TaxID=944322 RepID=A0A512J008_9HYPH|nr:pyridoxal phosphate-dependent aminotransferase [Methylobacterium oxalidis]GEP03287.1 aspartate aminotransferase [Methylobacterium oxalidis]GJE30382.1 Aspartate aminotransferase [Methylobacterium oxalidis]GLS64207.1 aspartate aminotransferase [Methylobacterium oxalidis]